MRNSGSSSSWKFWLNFTASCVPRSSQRSSLSNPGRLAAPSKWAAASLVRKFSEPTNPQNWDAQLIVVTKLGCTVYCCNKIRSTILFCRVGRVFRPPMFLAPTPAQYLPDWIVFMLMTGMMKMKILKTMILRWGASCELILLTQPCCRLSNQNLRLKNPKSMLWLLTQPCCCRHSKISDWKNSKSMFWYICTLSSPFNTLDTKPYKEGRSERFLITWSLKVMKVIIGQIQKWWW